jgi:hypothetical protein
MLGQKAMRATTAMLVAIALAAMLACAGPMQKVRQAAQRAKEQNDLKQIAIEYLNYESTNGKSPATLDEFLTFFDKSVGPNPISADLKSGKYIIYLDVKLKNLPSGTQNTVLGYEATVATAGGPVVMADGSARVMSAEEFNAAARPPAPAKPSKP